LDNCIFKNSNSINKLIICKNISYNKLFLDFNEIKYSFFLTNENERSIIYTTIKYKNKRRLFYE